MRVLSEKSASLDAGFDQFPVVFEISHFGNVENPAIGVIRSGSLYCLAAHDEILWKSCCSNQRVADVAVGGLKFD